MNFEQLLDGATKQPSNDNIGEILSAREELYRRCSPTAMREVWSALKKLTHETDCMITALGDRGVDLDSDGMIDAMDALESGRRALALLDGQTEERP